MKFSVAMCTYNGENYLEEQLNSILEQSLPLNEIIICDDNSTDRTIDILKQFEKNHPNIIKIYQNDKPLGTIKNFEKAISLTSGNLIFLSDQDDIWYKNKVEKMTAFFEKNSKCKLLFTDGALIDDNGSSLNSTLWEKWDFEKEVRDLWKCNMIAFKNLILNNNKITGATLCFHSSLKKKVLPITIPKGYWHDCWLGLHAAASNGLMFIEESLIDYRIHSNQQIGISIDKIIINNKFDKYFITKGEFYKKIKKLYPLLILYIPNHRKKNLIMRILLKIFKNAK